MKRVLLLAAAVVGSGLAAFAAPRAGCSCASPAPAPQDVAEATARALDVLCVSPAGRDLSIAHGFEFWGAFSEFEATDGSLEVRPGRPCGLTYMGTEDGSLAFIAAVERWAGGRGMAGSAMMRPDRGRRRGVGEIEWEVAPSAASGLRVVEVVYRPASIRERPEKAATTCS